MTRWKHHLTLKDLLTEDESPETVIVVSREFYNRLESWRLAHYPEDSDLEDIIDQFHSLGYCEPEPTCRWFNSAFSDLYDWADRDARLWIG